MILITAKFEKTDKKKTKTNLVFSTKEEIRPEELHQLILGEGWLAFNPDEYRAKVLAIVKNKRIGVKENELTHSERLRKVLYLVSQERGVENFDEFYAEQMDKIIDHYKFKYL